MTRDHRNKAANPDMWNAIKSGVNLALTQHPEIVIPEKFRESLIKRIIGPVLAVQRAQAGSGQPD